MKKSINAWSIEDKANFEEMFKAVKEAGFEGIELNVDKDDRSAHSLTLEKGTDLDAVLKLSEKYSPFNRRTFSASLKQWKENLWLSDFWIPPFMNSFPIPQRKLMN